MNETSAAPRRVLVADDNPHVRDIVEQALSRMSSDALRFNFMEAGGGDEVLEALWSDAFDMAILDIYMPVMDGVRLVSRIRAATPTPHACRCWWSRRAAPTPGKQPSPPAPIGSWRSRSSSSTCRTRPARC